MTNKAKLALIAALAMTRLAATPAFGQSFDEDNGTGNVLPMAYQSMLRMLRFVTQAFVPLVGMGSMPLRWSRVRSRISLHVSKRLSIQTIRRALAAAASVITNC